MNHAKPTYIIAEAGVNHNGDEARAHQLVQIAADAGADAVKFQLFAPASLTTKTAATAAYQAKNLNDGAISQQAMLEKLCLPDGAYERLEATCKKHGIDFICTPFDHASLDYLTSHTNMPYLKLPSGEVTNGPFLLAVARAGLPVIVSTGMSSLEEVGIALCILHFGFTQKTGYPKNIAQPTAQQLAELAGKVIILHCVSQYPAPVESTNLAALDTLKNAFHLPVGLSDHTLGITIPIAAVARGAAMIEKHFTYDVTAQGPDHAASLTPEQLTQMVRAIRDVETSIGDGKKTCQPAEASTRDIARKSLVAAGAIKKGEIFSEQNLAAKRPATGQLAPSQLWQLLGKAARASYNADDFILADELT